MQLSLHQSRFAALMLLIMVHGHIPVIIILTKLNLTMQCIWHAAAVIAANARSIPSDELAS